jgi:putative membrane protein
MPERLKEFLQRWVISTVAALIATYMVSGITYQTWVDLFVATFILGLLNTFVRPVLMLFSLPLLIFTLGLFTLIINALLLYFVGFLLAPRFDVTSFGAAFWGALVITIVSLVLNTLTGTGGARFKVETRRASPPPRPRDRDDDGGGPVIDV